MADEQIFTSCTNGGPVFVHVKDGKVIRMRPIVYDETDAPGWTIEANGKKYSPLRKACVASFSLTERARLYSDDRIKYPLKRKDFDPSGDRHPETRGKSEYDRISWDEALDMVSVEMKRIREKYGPAAIMSRASSHHMWGLLGYRTSAWQRFFNLIGFTNIWDNPDSWEGWVWGATHAWGFYWKLGLAEVYDALEDALKHTEMVVHWGNDPDTTRGDYGGQESAVWRLWLRDKRVKQIFIDPFCNFSAAIMADRWIAPRPGTDAAMAEAIAYVWLNEGTYDKEFVANRTLGFEEFKKHILGEDDGFPRTPGWAEEISGVPARVITALAREWAAKKTVLAPGTRAGMSSACRQAYAHEWTRLMVLLAAMQGVGKPGVAVWSTTTGAPHDTDFIFPGYGEGIVNNKLARKKAINPVKQRLWRILVPDAILNPPVRWLGTDGFCGASLDQQFEENVYPEPGHPEVRMFYRYGGSFIGTMTNTNRWVQMYQSPKLEFLVNQNVWIDPETRMADIVLPACTNLERVDIGEWANAGGYGHHINTACNYKVVVYQKKCIEPLYESKSDYQIFTELAERLGVKEEYTEGNSEEDWVKIIYDYSDMAKRMPFEEFKNKGYYVVPVPEGKKSTPGLRWFNEGRDCDTPDTYNPKRGTEKAKELGTYSGKIEFVSQSLLKHFPDDDERPPMPRYIPSWEGHESELAQKYPLQFISPHPRHSYHTHHDAHVDWLADIPSHRVYKDGYKWWPVRVHTQDAEERGIHDGDIIKLYNERGSVLGIAQVTERMRPGVVHAYESCGIYDPILKGTPGSVDRGGCVNLLTPSRMMSKNAPGMAPNSCLIEITKWEE
jgi:molybdopterin guanine dinucleotide-containing S/N-oxide reductase-like protein